MYRSVKIRTSFLVVGIIAVSVICFSVFFARNNVDTLAVTTNEKQIRLPVVMYHGILNDAKYQGTYVISPSQFESDLKTIREKSYTTVTVQDLVEYVYNNRPLPEKPIMLTFDDGYYNNYLYAYPLLKKYGYKAVISPIAYYSEYFSNTEEKVSATYFHCNWQQLKEMMESGYVEVQNHSYNMHAEKGRLGLQFKKNESENDYRTIIKKDITTAQEMFQENLQITPTAFVYPFGEFNAVSEKVIKELSFKCSMICAEKMNVITKDKECLYQLGRFIRTDKMTSDELFAKFDEE